MLPWFVGLQGDLETLEITESGTFTDLLIAHRDQIAARNSPSGLANRYGVIPTAFPAAVMLNGLGPLSDSIVCQLRHDKPTVIKDERTLLFGSNKDRDEYIVE